MLKRKYTTIVTATTWCVCGLLVTDACADLKLEQTLTVSGAPKRDRGKITIAKPTTEKIVTYYKDGKQRTETADSVVIHDAVNEKTFFLDPRKKTFYEASSAGAVTTDDSNPMAAMAKMGELDGDVVVTDLKEEKTILGKKAHRYSYIMTLKFSLKDPNAPAMMAAFLPSFVTTGDQWMAEIPDSFVFAKRNGQSAFAGLPSGLGKSFMPLVEKMGKMKGIPLEATHSSKMSFGESAPAQMTANMPKEPTVRQTITTALSEAPLPDSLFSVPDDYKKVKAPGEKK
ncbi:MAG: hypothetical protein H8F28_10540 [Fibrella sp.]|nr:hypothetical protein [Armatimonadota bacterium]